MCFDWCGWGYDPNKVKTSSHADSLACHCVQLVIDHLHEIVSLELKTKRWISLACKVLFHLDSSRGNSFLFNTNSFPQWHWPTLEALHEVKKLERRKNQTAI